MSCRNLVVSLRDFLRSGTAGSEGVTREEALTRLPGALAGALAALLGFPGPPAAAPAPLALFDFIFARWKARNSVPVFSFAHFDS